MLTNIEGPHPSPEQKKNPQESYTLCSPVDLTMSEPYKTSNKKISHSNSPSKHFQELSDVIESAPPQKPNEMGKIS
jgi:hypothetical protein